MSAVVWAPELGRLSLILACITGLCLCALALPQLSRRLPAAVFARLPRTLCAVQLAACAAAFLLLEIALVSDDFSLAYVQTNSHTDLPLFYKMAALWGAHEGSLLLWVLLLALWCLLAPERPGAALPPTAALGAICASFAAFTLLTSDPFARLLPLPPLQGADLNPVLQHPALAVHPPILYAGYTAMSVPFALALAGLTVAQAPQRFGAEPARQMQPWALIALGLLTAGIALGSWWAYQELGWGGWWFWDPVENLSTLPWLCAVALVHALAIAKKRSSDYGWCLLLAVLGFPLAVLGAFIIRSGLLVSVHSFSNDPGRGLFLLVLLAAISLPAVLLLLRSPSVRARPRPLTSRETLLLVCGALMMLTAAIILLGTLYPLLYEAFTGERAAVGAPYYQAVLLPLFLTGVAVMAAVPLSRWGRRPRLPSGGAPVLAGSALLGAVVPFAFGGEFSVQTASVALMSAALTSVLGLLLVRALYGESSVRQELKAHWRMTLAHTGAVTIALGALWQGSLGVQREVLISPGQTLQTPVGELLLEHVRRIEGGNYRADQASFLLLGTEPPIRLRPEKRLYIARDQLLSEAAITRIGAGDLYLNLGQKGEDGSWSLRLHYKPLIGLIWLGAAVISLAALLMALLTLSASGRAATGSSAGKATGGSTGAATSSSAGEAQHV